MRTFPSPQVGSELSLGVIKMAKVKFFSIPSSRVGTKWKGLTDISTNAFFHPLKSGRNNGSGQRNCGSKLFFHPLKSGRNLALLYPVYGFGVVFHPLKSGRNSIPLMDIDFAFHEFSIPSSRVGTRWWSRWRW